MRINQELIVSGTPKPELARALVFLSERLHSEIGRERSKVACVFCSLIIRDFLLEIGFGASVASVIAAYGSNAGGPMSLMGTIGQPSAPVYGFDWAGHLVVISDGFLIDATARPQGSWSGPRGMLVAPLLPEPRPLQFGSPVMARIVAKRGNVTFCFLWCDTKNNGWESKPDATWDFRDQVVANLVSRFRSRYGSMVM